MSRQHAHNASQYCKEADIAFHISISSPIKGSHEGILEDHAKVFNAFKNRKPERAKQAILALIDEALNFIENAIAM